jgi:CIC family chloride channel protein
MAQIEPAHNRQVNLITLSLIAVVIGTVTGLGAVFLRWLIGVIHNLFFLGQFASGYDANMPTAESPFGAWVILAPVIGGAIVVFLVNKFAPEARGHGVPEVMDAIYFRNGYIRPAVVVIKSLASALSIGSGASVGREGPIIQIGSGIGSVLGRALHLRHWQVITMVAAGAGAGIAATFNTPLGAVMFAIELMLPEFSARTFLPVVLATGAATYVGRLVFGNEPAFLVASYNLPDPFVPLSLDSLPLFAILGVLAGIASWLFVWLLHWLEDRFDAMPFNAYIRNAIGMLFLGVLFYVMMRTTGMYQTAGVGYATIQAILNGGITAAGLLMVLFVAKLLATCISLASGASGGIFSPSLFLGATLGGAFGSTLDAIWPQLGFSPITFALVGMAGLVGGSTGAAMTAIMMIFEMTGDYNITLAAIIAVATAIGTRRALVVENIYTMKLARRGHHVPKDHRTHMFPIRLATEVMKPVVASVQVTDLVRIPATLSDILPADMVHVVVARGRVILGIALVDKNDFTRAYSPIRTKFGIARENNLLEIILTRMVERGHEFDLVVKGKGVPRPENVVGVVSHASITASVLHDYKV